MWTVACKTGLFLFYKSLMEAELVDKMRDDRVLAPPVAKDMPGDLRWTSDEEVEALDVRVVVASVVVTAHRGRGEDGAPPKREAPEPKYLRARYPIVSSPAAGREDPGHHGLQHSEAISTWHGRVATPIRSGPRFRDIQKSFGRGRRGGRLMASMIQRRQSSQQQECDLHPRGRGSVSF